MVTKLSVDSELQFSNSSNSPPSGFTATFKSVSEILVNHSAMPVMQEREELLTRMLMVQKNGTKGLCLKLLIAFESWYATNKYRLLAVIGTEMNVNCTLLYIELTRSKTLDFTWTIG